mgnify:CR=1 FL=1
MKEEQLGSRKKSYIILDTTAFLAKYPLQHYSSHELLTTAYVLSELRDHESKEAFEIASNIGRVKVVQPDKKFIDKAINVAKSIGEHTSLSKTDISILALALQYSLYGHVIVITDDYALQNTLLYVGIPFKPLRTTGIKQFRRYTVICPTCGYVSSNIGEKTCPLCNSKLIKKKFS